MVAGEASGDMYGGSLARSFRDLVPGISLYGAGGDEMRGAGVNLIADIKDLSVMGIAEIISRIRPLLRIKKRLSTELLHNPPDGLVVIDFPGMNMTLAQKAKEAGVPVVYYVAPKLWVSRKGRIGKLRRCVDRILAIFPFEEEFFREQGVPVTYVGNPIMDFLKQDSSYEQFRRRHSLNGAGKVVGILPGSRPAEVQRLLPVFLEACSLILAELEGPVRFFLPRASTAPDEMIRRIIADSGLDVTVVEGESRQVLRAADVSLVTSGTATLEAFLLGAPQVVAYKTSRLTYFIGMRMLNVPRVSLPNLLTGRDVVVELLQDQVIPERLAMESLGLLMSEDARRNYTEAGNEVRQALRGEGASLTAARTALETFAI